MPASGSAAWCSTGSWPEHAVFVDPFARLYEDPDHSETESRFLLVGHSLRGRMLLVVHAEKGDTIRIISARKV